jgi:predicted nucleic acid-binding Zn ribbon protein
MPYTRTPDKIQRVIDALYNQLNFDKAAQEHRAVKMWSEVAGNYIARVSEVEKMHNGTLFVKVKNSTWRNELIFKKAGIIEEMNRRLGKEMVKEIVFK